MLIKKENWILFQIASGDTNRLHFDGDYARKKGFKEPIAPGMYASSLIEKESWFKNCKELDLKFVKEVKEGDTIKIIKKGEEILWENQNSEKVITGYISNIHEPITKEGTLSYERVMEKHDISRFLEAIDARQRENKEVPRMYLASLIPSALLRYHDKDGAYRRQGLMFHDEAYIGDKIKVYISKINEKRGIETFSTVCVNQAGELLVSGRATCLPLEDKLQ